MPASPRARRRLLWLGGLAALAGTAVAIAVLVPGTSPPPAAPSGGEGPAQLASSGATARLTPADRRSMDAALDAFIPAAMERRDPARAWALAGPELRASSSLADWRTGDSPVPYYLPRETTFHDWRVIDVEPGGVIFNLLLHPRRRSVGSYEFSGEFVRERGRWLVNRIYTIAIMKPPTRTGLHEVGPADFAAPSGAAATPARPLLGRAGILPVAAVLGLVLLVPLVLGLVALTRARRWRRRVRAGDRNGLPPLPTGYLLASEEAREATGNS